MEKDLLELEREKLKLQKERLEFEQYKKGLIKDNGFNNQPTSIQPKVKKQVKLSSKLLTALWWFIILYGFFIFLAIIGFGIEMSYNPIEWATNVKGKLENFSNASYFFAIGTIISLCCWTFFGGSKKKAKVTLFVLRIIIFFIFTVLIIYWRENVTLLNLEKTLNNIKIVSGIELSITIIHFITVIVIGFKEVAQERQKEKVAHESTAYDIDLK